MVRIKTRTRRAWQDLAFEAESSENNFTSMAELASKSMTAVTSVVTVVREETVIALRCNTRGTEQIALPLMATPLMVIAIVLIAVGVGLPF